MGVDDDGADGADEEEAGDGRAEDEWTGARERWSGGGAPHGARVEDGRFGGKVRGKTP